MTLTLTIPTRSRHLSWAWLILLPVLPWLGNQMRGNDLRDWSRPDLGGTLLVVGAALALLIPGWVSSLKAAARKEVEQLRPAWLASVFLGQSAAIFTTNQARLEVMFFAATCALLAGVLIGGEFQQRTLPGLLTQPVARSAWWRLKTGVLAVGLGLHWILFLVAEVAAGKGVDGVFALGTLVAAAVAFGTTPWWTMLTRGLMAGLVFSLAAPLVGLFVLAALLDVWGIGDLVFLAVPATDRAWFYLVLFIAAPAYALAGSVWGYRRWMRLEAPDRTDAEGGMLGLPRLRWEAMEGGLRGRWMRLGPVIGKELRLQGATVVMVIVTIVLALFGLTWGEAGASGSVIASEGLRMCLFLMGIGTVLLAGSTMIAEERRLGTLEAQLLSPLSRAAQWWIKLLVASALAAGTVCLLIAVGGRTLNPPQEAAGLMTAVMVGALVLFIPGVLASSGSSNALRAVILAMGVGAYLAVVLALSVNSVERERHWEVDFIARFAHEPMDPESLKAAAAALSAGEVDALKAWSQDPARLNGRFLKWTQGLPLLAGLLALWCARRNFTHPADAGRRMPAQMGLCLGVFTMLAVVSPAVATQMARASMEKSQLLMVLQARELEAQLTPAERQLWEAHRPRPWARNISLEMAPIPGRARQVLRRIFVLPLSSQDRQAIIERGWISENLREDLLREALDRGEPAGAIAPLQSEPAAGHGNLRTGETPFPIDPELMRRYGIIPQGESMEAQESPERAPRQRSQPVFQMSPELMRRYGLQPKVEPPAEVNPGEPSTP